MADPQNTKGVEISKTTASTVEETVQDIRRKARTPIEHSAGEIFCGRESANCFGRIKGRRKDI
jgi:hypothetical protein